MQEITFAVPKSGPKARPAPGREDAAAVTPAERRSSDRRREDDFGAVVDAEERAAAKKPAADAGKAEAAPAAESVSPTDEDAAPADASAFDAEAGGDEVSVIPIPVSVDPETAPAEGDLSMVDAVLADEATVETVAPDGAEVVVAPVTAGPQGAVGAVGSVGAAVPTVMASTQAAPAAPPVIDDAADAPPPEADVVRATRAGPEAPSGTAQAADIRAALPVQPQAAAQPALAGGFALGGVVTDGLDWRLTPHVHAHAPAHAAAQAQPQAVTGQIAVAIAQSANSRIEVRLDPPELGRVQIQLNPTERGVQVIVMSERPETGDFLRRHAETLARDLAEAGYGDVTMEFTAGGSDTPRQRDGAEASAPRALASAETRSAVVESAPERPRAVAAGSLDIRL